MSDEAPVTVNIVGNLAPLQEALAKGAQMVDAFTTNVAQASTGGGSSGSSTRTENTADTSSPYAPTVSIGNRLVAQLSELETTGDASAESVARSRKLLVEVTRTLEELLGALLVLTTDNKDGLDNDQLTSIEKAIASLEEILAQGLSVDTTDLASSIATALAGVVVDVNQVNAPEPASEPTPIETPEPIETIPPPEAVATEPNIVDSTVKEKAPVVLPSYKDDQLQMEALLRVTRQLIAERREMDMLTANGVAIDQDRYDQLSSAIGEATTQLRGYAEAGMKVREKKAPSNDPLVAPLVGGMEMPNIQGDDRAQYDALSEYDGLLSQVQEKLEQTGQTGTAAYMAVSERISAVRAELDQLDSQFAEEDSKKPKEKKAAAATPPPLPQEEVAPSLMDTTENIIKMTEAAGVSTGGIGTLTKYLGTLGSTAALIPPPAMAIVGALVGVAAIAAVAVVSIGAIVTVLTEVISAANSAYLEIIKLSGSLGSLEGGKARIKDIQLEVEGTGIDPKEIVALHDNLSRRARDMLLEGPGLDLLVRATARLDPTNVSGFGQAIASAVDNLSTGGNIESNIEQLNQLGLITDESAKRLETMSIRGAHYTQMWRELYLALDENSKAAGNANESLGGLMNRLGVDISSTWNQMLKTMGERIVAVLGPAFNDLMGVLEQTKPIFIGIASSVGEYLGVVGAMVSNLVRETAVALGTISNLFKSGNLFEFVKLYLAKAFLEANNTLVNGMLNGVKYIGEVFKASFEALGSSDFWVGIGIMLAGAVDIMLGKLAGIHAVLFNALDPIVGWLLDAFTVMGSKLVAAFRLGYAATLNDGPQKDEMWNKGMEALNMDMTKAKAAREADGSSSLGLAAVGAKIIAEGMEKRGRNRIEGGSNITAAALANTESGRAIDSEAYKVDMFGKEVKMLGDRIDNLWNANKPKLASETAKDTTTPVIPTIDRKEVIPQSVADSLQSVGGDGMAAGMSIDEKILEQNKEQNRHLTKIAEGTSANLEPKTTATANVSGAFGVKGQDTSVAILQSIHSTLVGIYNVLVRQGSPQAQTVGSLVTSRG